MPDLVRFTETMAGWLSPRVELPYVDAERAGRVAASPGLFVLTIVTTDVDALVADPNHRSPAYGCVILPALHAAPLRVRDGHLDLFVDTALGSRVVHMRYELALEDDDGRPWFLRGIKEVVRRAWYPTALADTTTLFVDVFPGTDATGVPALRGALRMGVGGVTAQGLSFRFTGGWLGLRGLARYLAYYVRRAAHVYLGPRTTPALWPAAPSATQPAAP